MQMQYVACGIVQLLRSQLIGPPVRGLLLLGKLDVKQLLGQILESVSVGEGAGKPRSNLGAVDWSRHDAKSVLKHCHVEAGEVEDLEHGLVGEQTLQLRRLVVPADLHE